MAADGKKLRRSELAESGAESGEEVNDNGRRLNWIGKKSAARRMRMRYEGRRSVFGQGVVAAAKRPLRCIVKNDWLKGPAHDAARAGNSRDVAIGGGREMALEAKWTTQPGRAEEAWIGLSDG